MSAFAEACHHHHHHPRHQQHHQYDTQVEMGLTWIDHDVIEVPVEEIEVGGQRQIISFF